MIAAVRELGYGAKRVDRSTVLVDGRVTVRCEVAREDREGKASFRAGNREYADAYYLVAITRNGTARTMVIPAEEVRQSLGHQTNLVFKLDPSVRAVRSWMGFEDRMDVIEAEIIRKRMGWTAN